MASSRERRGANTAPSCERRCCRRAASQARRWATIARLNGLNANVVHRWRVNERNAMMPAMQEPPSGFLAVNIIPEILIAPDPLPPPDIRVEVTRVNATIVVKWPLQDSAACAVWLREWLRLNSY